MSICARFLFSDQTLVKCILWLIIQGLSNHINNYTPWLETVEISNIYIILSGLIWCKPHKGTYCLQSDMVYPQTTGSIISDSDEQHP